MRRRLGRCGGGCSDVASARAMRRSAAFCFLVGICLNGLGPSKGE
jgi:hypothetical protein